jgi:hypothetical protein
MAFVLRPSFLNGHVAWSLEMSPFNYFLPKTLLCNRHLYEDIYPSPFTNYQ